MTLCLKIGKIVNKFGRGIGRIQRELQANGNPPAIFSMEWVTVFTAKVFAASAKGQETMRVIHGVRVALKNATKDMNEAVSCRYIAVFDLIAKNPAISFSAITDATGISKRSISEYVDFMKELGIIERIGGRKEGEWKVKVP